MHFNDTFIACSGNVSKERILKKANVEIKDKIYQGKDKASRQHPTNSIATNWPQ